jgi:hypothetical protein
MQYQPKLCSIEKIMLVSLGYSSSLVVLFMPAIKSNAQEAKMICKSSSLPAGYIITGEYSSNECPGSGKNSYKIEVPAPRGDYMCSVSPIPFGFFVNFVMTSSVCPGSKNNVYRIQVPDQYANFMCKLSPPPFRYVIVGEYPSDSCPDGKKYFIESK